VCLLRECVSVCPVGALSEKAAVKGVNGNWTRATICSYCGVGCTLVLNTKIRDTEVTSDRALA